MAYEPNIAKVRLNGKYLRSAETAVFEHMFSSLRMSHVHYCPFMMLARKKQDQYGEWFREWSDPIV